MSVASAVTSPWKTPTESAEKMQPLPIDAAIAQTMIASMEPLSARADQSPARPSWMEPTMAIAPTERVSDAVTKPSTKRGSPELPVWSRSHFPRSSKRASMSMTSPMTVPSAIDTTSIIVPVVERRTVPSSATVATSMCWSVPAMPTNTMHAPHARRSASCRRSVTSELAARPMSPPIMIRVTLMKVPRPGIGLLNWFVRSFSIQAADKRHLRSRLDSCDACGMDGAYSSLKPEKRRTHGLP